MIKIIVGGIYRHKTSKELVKILRITHIEHLLFVLVHFKFIDSFKKTTNRVETFHLRVDNTMNEFNNNFYFDTESTWTYYLESPE